MKNFTKEERELLEKNPNVKSVTINQIYYTEEFKDKAIKEYLEGKSANQIFREAGINIEEISIQTSYASSILSKWRKRKQNGSSVHYQQKQVKENKTAYQKLLQRNEYLEAENEFLKSESELRLKLWN